MLKKVTIILIVFILNQQLVLAQDTDKIKVQYKVEGKDTIALYNLETTELNSFETPDYLEKQKGWIRLVYNIRIVLPMADSIVIKMKEVDDAKAQYQSNRKRNKYWNNKKAELKEMYAAQLKNLTKDQGELLIKMVSRQSGKTVYSIIKDYDSGLNAMMWQTASTMYGMDLKFVYDRNSDANTHVEYAILKAGFR